MSKDKLYKNLPNNVSTLFLILMIVATTLLAFNTYDLYSELEKMELQIENRRVIHENAISGLREEGMLEDFLDMDQFTDEEREQIEDFIEELTDEEVNEEVNEEVLEEDDN